MDYDVIEVPYEGDALSMLLVSPFEPDVPLSALTSELNSQSLKQWRAGLRNGKKQLAIPRYVSDLRGWGEGGWTLFSLTVCHVDRFTMTSELHMKKVLTDMGLGNMFNLATADFTRITSEFFIKQFSLTNTAFLKVFVQIVQCIYKKAVELKAVPAKECPFSFYYFSLNSHTTVLFSAHLSSLTDSLSKKNKKKTIHYP